MRLQGLKGHSSMLSWMPVMWSSMHFNQLGRCFRFAFLLWKRTGQLSLTEVWICTNFHTKFSHGHVVCINSHINSLVLIQSSSCLSFMFAPSVTMDNSCTLTQLPFLPAIYMALKIIPRLLLISPDVQRQHWLTCTLTCLRHLSACASAELYTVHEVQFPEILLS